MKKIFSIMAVAGALMMTSCDKWLDVNDNPNTPNTKVPSVDLRLPSIIARFAEAYESGGTRAAIISQQLAGTTANNWALSRWNISTSAVNWPYQPWYIYTANNIPDLIEKGEATGANHYIGAGKVIWAWGFAAFSDMYGMLPYEEAFQGGLMTPKYDQGDLIYEKCLVELDQAIEYLQKGQDAAAPALSVGDYLFKGDTQKWIALANGIKARMLNHLSKTDKFNAAEVLALLEKAPKTASESALYQYQDRAESTKPETESLQYQNNGSNRLTKLYIDYVLGDYTGAPTGASNMEDPRADLLIPRFIATGLRTPGVDMSVIPESGFGSTLTTYAALRPTANVSTGSVYAAAGAKGLLLTSSEMHFIKAEILFNQNNKAGALQAYKDGIKDHMEILGVPAAKITSYLASSSVQQSASALTLSQIMIQKYIALSYSPEVFNDVRRLEFCTDASGKYNESVGIYKGLKRPGAVFTIALPSEDMWPRRFTIASYSINYNYDQVIKADPDAADATYTAKRIWWDVKK